MTGPSPADRATRITVGALATYRLARILPHDQVADPLRRRLHLWAAGGTDRTAWVRRWLVDLVTCPVCSGFWIAGAITVMSRGDRRQRWTVSTVDWAATAGLAALMTRTADPEVQAVQQVPPGSTAPHYWSGTTGAATGGNVTVTDITGRLPGPSV